MFSKAKKEEKKINIDFKQLNDSYTEKYCYLVEIIFKAMTYAL